MGSVAGGQGRQRDNHIFLLNTVKLKRVGREEDAAAGDEGERIASKEAVELLDRSRGKNADLGDATLGKIDPKNHPAGVLGNFHQESRDFQNSLDAIGRTLDLYRRPEGKGGSGMTRDVLLPALVDPFRVGG
jgi:hypothetical protein